MRRAVVFVVWDSSTAMSVGLEPKDYNWEMLEVQWQEAAAIAMTTEEMLRME